MYMNLVHDLDLFFLQKKDEIFFFIKNYEPKDLKKIVGILNFVLR